MYRRRALVEGAFGILKSSSRLRMRRGHIRISSLAHATIVAAVKISLFNEEQMRAWHQRTGRGPADHPLLQPDSIYHGFLDLTADEAQAINAHHLQVLADGVDQAA